MSTQSGATGYGRLQIILAALLWGTTGTAQALAPVGAQPVVVGAVRLLIGGLTLLLLAAGRGHLRRGGPWPWQSTAVAALSIATYQLTFFAGVSRTGVAIGTVVGIGSAPILAGIMAFLVWRQRPERRWWWATLLAVAGCGLLIAPQGQVKVDVGGILLALTAGGAYAAYTLASQRLLQTQAPDAVTAVTFTLGALTLSPFLFTADLFWLMNGRGMVVALHLGVVTTAVAYTLFARGLREVPVATAVTLTLAEPLTAATLGLFLLGEPLTPLTLLGIASLIAGLLLLL